jgi:hypothetical protein
MKPLSMKLIVLLVAVFLVLGGGLGAALSLKALCRPLRLRYKHLLPLLRWLLSPFTAAQWLIRTVQPPALAGLSP